MWTDPPSRRPAENLPERAHQPVGVRSLETWINPPQPIHRQMIGDCFWNSDTN